jgi:2-polyprenyl-3-methyl-5-hydroxy-6-metoxy-1,4-benzoquinol methylase
VTASTKERAELSRGTSAMAIYQMVANAIYQNHSSKGLVVDVGCGTGNLWDFVHRSFDRYVGVDVNRFDGFPEDCEFIELDLDTGKAPLPNDFADVVVSVETIEHLENPRALVRELTRVCKPGGLVIVTTPNQLSFLSKLTLLLKNQFNAFTDPCYPAHITALLETDLMRIANECSLLTLEIHYTKQGRIPGTARHFPGWLSHIRPRAFSDNLLLLGRKPCA